MRLIDADALKELRDKYIRGQISFNNESDLVDKCPTIDAVIVTRCKDCEECCSELNSWSGHPFCGLSGEYVEYDDYCAWANRREEE